jgi:hypothetical protein
LQASNRNKERFHLNSGPAKQSKTKQFASFEQKQGEIPFELWTCQAEQNETIHREHRLTSLHWFPRRHGQFCEIFSWRNGATQARPFICHTSGRVKLTCARLHYSRLLVLVYSRLQGGYTGVYGLL